jgi:uncharacterized membrane protein
MASFTVLNFSTADAANMTVELLDRFQAQRLVAIEDAATIFWPPTFDEPTLCRIHHLEGEDRLAGAFWGLLFGFVLFVPRTPARPRRSALRGGGPFADFGLDDDFLERVRERITPGSFVLVLFTRDSVESTLTAVLQNVNLPCDMIVAHVPAARMECLRDVFAVRSVDVRGPTTPSPIESEAVDLY